MGASFWPTQTCRWRSMMESGTTWWCCISFWCQTPSEATPNRSFLASRNFSVSTEWHFLATQLSYFSFTTSAANIGGLLGLFMGFSALSLVEIFYFMTLRPYYINQRRNSLRQRFNIVSWDLCVLARCLCIRPLCQVTNSKYFSMSLEKFCLPLYTLTLLSLHATSIAARLLVCVAQQ